MVIATGHATTLTLALSLSVLAAGCGSGGGPPAGGTPAPPTTGAAGSVRYEGVGTVLQAPGRGPELCLGAVAESLPPQCEGLPLAGWDWGAVEREQSASGTTWGEYRVTGTYDGTTFTVTAPAVPATPTPTLDRPRIPCPEPHNGYLDRVPAQATADRLQQALALARSQPDLGGLWIDTPGQPRPDGSVRQGGVVLNATFTGNLDTRRTELEAVWGGFVCVTKADRALADLRRIQAEVVGSPPPGLDLLGIAVLESLNQVHLSVVLAPPGAQEALDARFGPGAVVLDSALRAVG